MHPNTRWSQLQGMVRLGSCSSILAFLHRNMLTHTISPDFAQSTSTCYTTQYLQKEQHMEDRGCEVCLVRCCDFCVAAIALVLLDGIASYRDNLIQLPRYVVVRALFLWVQFKDSYHIVLEPVILKWQLESCVSSVRNSSVCCLVGLDFKHNLYKEPKIVCALGMKWCVRVWIKRPHFFLT